MRFPCCYGATSLASQNRVKTKRSVIVLVVNEEFAIWKDASTQTLLRGDPLKHIDVEGMRVVTNNRCVAERIKSDKVESVATGRQKMENLETLAEDKI